MNTLNRTMTSANNNISRLERRIKSLEELTNEIINLNIKSNVKNILLGFVEYLYLREK